ISNPRYRHACYSSRSAVARPARRSALQGDGRKNEFPPNMSEKPSFFAELKRRNVYKVAVAYAVVGWVIAQIATQIFPFLEIPNWIVRLVIVLVAAGLPFAVVIAWEFDVHPRR